MLLQVIMRISRCGDGRTPWGDEVTPGDGLFPSPNVMRRLVRGYARSALYLQ